MEESEMVRTELAGQVAVITLDRPERRNALDHATLLELLDVQDRLRGEITAARTRAVVLTGAPPAFSAGADLTGVEEGQFATDLGSVLRNFTTLAGAGSRSDRRSGAGRRHATRRCVRPSDRNAGQPARHPGGEARPRRRSLDDATGGRRVHDADRAQHARRCRDLHGADLHRTGGIHRLGDREAAMEWANGSRARAAHDGRPQARSRGGRRTARRRPLRITAHGSLGRATTPRRVAPRSSRSGVRSSAASSGRVSRSSLNRARPDALPSSSGVGSRPDRSA